MFIERILGVSLLIVVFVFAMGSAALALAANPGDEIFVKKGTETNLLAKIKCGNRVLITNISPLPEGCVVLKTYTTIPQSDIKVEKKNAIEQETKK